MGVIQRFGESELVVTGRAVIRGNNGVLVARRVEITLPVGLGQGVCTFPGMGVAWLVGDLTEGKRVSLGVRVRFCWFTELGWRVGVVVAAGGIGVDVGTLVGRGVADGALGDGFCVGWPPPSSFWLRITCKAWS